MEGVGEMTWPSGDKYIGDWEADTRTGHGLYLYSSGNRYKGQYANNKKVTCLDIHFTDPTPKVCHLKSSSVSVSSLLKMA